MKKIEHVIFIWFNPPFNKVVSTDISSIDQQTFFKV